MAKEPASETKRIEATHGPYRGTQLDLPTADAEQAIKDGWARDPFAAIDPNAEPVEFDQDKHDKAEAAAEKAVRKMRGEDEPADERKRPAADNEQKKPAEDTSAARRPRSRD